MGLSAPSFRCGLDLRGAGARRNAPSTPDGAQPGRIDATRRRRQLHGVGRRLRAGTASLPRAVRRASSAARRPLQPPVVRCNRPSSVATAAGRPLGIRSCSAVAATCIDHVSSAQCVVLQDSAPSRRNPAFGTAGSGCSHRHVGMRVPRLHRRHLQPPPVVRCRLRTAARSRAVGRHE